jgi:uncharacterized protein YbbC (DUF1343 family)
MKTLLTLVLCLMSFSVMALDYGIDRLDESEVAQKFVGKNLAVLTHAAGKSKDGTHLIDFLHQKFTLKKIFAPEHGLRTMADDWVEDGIDEATGLPVISLYKRGSKAPKPEDLKGIDAIVIDLQDVGVRYYTYFSTIAEVMKAVAPLNVEVILLDRPNLLGGMLMEGKVLDANLAGSFTAYHTVPTRHGMTLGELALMINAEKKMGTKLTVIPASGWTRENLLSNTDRPWLAPSPALVDISQVGLYALWGTLENFNLAVGRGIKNEMAFRVLGAPWITIEESNKLADALNAMNFKGATFRPYSWKATRATYEGKMVNGVVLEWDGSEIRTDEFTYKVASLLVKLFKDRLNVANMSAASYGSSTMVNAIKTQVPWETYSSVIDTDLQNFKIRRKPYLLYESRSFR